MQYMLRLPLLLTTSLHFLCLPTAITHMLLFHKFVEVCESAGFGKVTYLLTSIMDALGSETQQCVHFSRGVLISRGGE